MSSTGDRWLLTDVDFAAVRDFLAATAGLAFDETRRAGLAVVVAGRLRTTGSADVASYLALVSSTAGATERQHLVDAVTVQETHFFRNSPQMLALRGRVLPDLLRRAGLRDRPLTIWSAGCSTGEEPYTLAMLVHELSAPTSGGAPTAVRIVATDVSAAALDVARQATYAGRTLATLPAAARERWFDPRPRGALAVREDVRRCVELRLHNLVTEPPPFGRGEVDLVVCRNVTIYFSRATTRTLMGAFHDVLGDGGYLLLGHAETLWQVSDAFALVPVGDAFVYRRSADPRSAAPVRQGLRTRPRSRLRPAVRRVRPGGPALPADGRVESADRESRSTVQVAAAPRLAAARAAMASGDYREAARLAELAVVAEPLLGDPYVVLGQARSTLGLDAEALEPLRKAVYVDPAAGHAHFLLGGALARLGQHGPAAAAYRAAAASLDRVPPDRLAPFLGGRAVTELVELCERLAEAAAAAGGVAAPDALNAGRGNVVRTVW